VCWGRFPVGIPLIVIIEHIDLGGCRFVLYRACFIDIEVLNRLLCRVDRSVVWVTIIDS
jgi:hypothetical protein